MVNRLYPCEEEEKYGRGHSLSLSLTLVIKGITKERSKERLAEQFVLFLRHFMLVNCRFGGICRCLWTVEGGGACFGADV